METRPTFSKRILDQMAQRIFASAANSKQMGNDQAKHPSRRRGSAKRRNPQKQMEVGIGWSVQQGEDGNVRAANIKQGK